MSKKFLITLLAVFLLLYGLSSALTNKVFAEQGVFEKWYSWEARGAAVE